MTPQSNGQSEGSRCPYSVWSKSKINSNGYFSIEKILLQEALNNCKGILNEVKSLMLMTVFFMLKSHLQ